jgi:tyrosine-protein kinase Etk/Wzc
MNINEAKEATLDNLVRIYWMHKKFIGIFIAAFLVLLTLYSFIMPVQYESEGSIMPPEESSGGGGLSSFLQSFSSNINIGGVQQSGKSQLISEFINSRELSKFIINKLKLQSHPFYKEMKLKELYALVTEMVEPKVNRSGLLTIFSRVGTSYFPTSEDKEEAAKLSADIINAAIEGVDYIFRQKNISKAKRKREFIEKMLVKKKNELDSVDRLIEQFQSSNQVLEIEAQTSAIIGSAVDIGVELSKAELELQMKLQEFSPNSPAVQPYRQLVETLKNQYQNIQRGGLIKSDDFSIPLKQVPKLIREYRDLVRDQKILEQVNLYLETQNYQEAIQEASDITTIEPLDTAIIPITNSSPNRKMMLIIGLFVGLSFALIIVTIRAFVKGKLYFNRESA